MPAFSCTDFSNFSWIPVADPHPFEFFRVSGGCFMFPLFPMATPLITVDSIRVFWKYTNVYKSTSQIPFSISVFSKWQSTSINGRVWIRSMISWSLPITKLICTSEYSGYVMTRERQNMHLFFKNMAYYMQVFSGKYA